MKKQWSMDETAEKIDINLQYCMSLARHIRTALQISRVTHARTSCDYASHLRYIIDIDVERKESCSNYEIWKDKILIFFSLRINQITF